MVLPSFYDPTKVGDLYLERAARVADEAHHTRQSLGIKPASQDSFRVAAFGIDCQVGFCLPGASLFVPGAVDDMRRAIEWLYRNLPQLTGLYLSLDTHRLFQIFHPVWWVGPDGNHPAPFTTITTSEVRSGRWIPQMRQDLCLEYVERLEATGRLALTVWPYHTLLGGVSHALVPALMEASIFHSVARAEQTHFETKGSHALTENYSVLAPEVRELGGETVGTFNQSFLDLLMSHDRVYVFGEAKSHCVLATLEDIRKSAADPKLLDRVYILEDAMSPVLPPPLEPLPESLDFPRLANDALRRFAASGMHVVQTTDPLPGRE